MKKIFIACSKWCYNFVPIVQNRLRQLGYEVILPNFFDDPMIEERIKNGMTQEEHIDFCHNSFKISQNKAKESDMLLILNFNKIKDGIVFENYIGGATFLEMYDSYLLEHPIFLYNDIPEGMLHDEIEGMNPTILNGDLFSILEVDDFSKISPNNNLLKYFSYEDLLKLKKCDDLYLKAAIIIRKLFNGVYDKENEPYIRHLIRVSDSLDSYDQIVAGLLHDVVEDTEITCRDLLEIGFNKEIVKIIYIVTNEIVDKSNMTEDEKLLIYNRKIDSIIYSGNNDAMLLKQKDIEDNYNPLRLAYLSFDEQQWFHKKYGKQLVKLKKINKERN